MQWKLFVALIMALFVAIFALQNSDPVSVHFLMFGVQMSQALIIIISAVVGALLSLFLGLIKQFSLMNTIRDREKKIRNLERENASITVENKILEQKEELNTKQEDSKITD